MKVPVWVCVIVGLVCGAIGFFGGVASTEFGREFFADITRVEAAADVENPKTLGTDFYQLKYPGNWNLDEDDPDFDLEGYLLIESAGSNFVLLAFAHYNADLDEELAHYSEEYESMMNNAKTSEFSRYGSLEGKGKRIEGKLYGSKATVEVFCGNVNGITVSVVEWLYMSDAKDVLPGFELIESSFSMIDESALRNLPVPKPGKE